MKEYSEIIITVVMLIIRYFERKALIKKKDEQAAQEREDLRFKFSQEKANILNSTKRF